MLHVASAAMKDKTAPHDHTPSETEVCRDVATSLFMRRKVRIPHLGDWKRTSWHIGDLTFVFPLA